jgi:hypothetical protein
MIRARLPIPTLRVLTTDQTLNDLGRGDRDGVTPLFIMNADQLTVVTAGRSPKPGAGQKTIGLAPASSKSGDARRASTP